MHPFDTLMEDTGEIEIRKCKNNQKMCTSYIDFVRNIYPHFVGIQFCYTYPHHFWQ